MKSADEVRDALKGAARKWWEENGETLLDLPRDEVVQLARSLSGGGYTSKVELYRKLTDDELLAAQRKTYDELSDLALRRVMLIQALTALGRDAARAVGRAMLGL